MQSGRFWILTAATSLLLSATAAHADTTSVKAWQVARVAKTGAHCVDDRNCMNRMHPAIKPVSRANPGQHIVFETRWSIRSLAPSTSRVPSAATC